MIPRSISNKPTHKVVSLLLLFCIVRCSLVMTVDISIFNLTVVIAAGGLGLLYLLLSNRIYRENFLTFNFTFLVLCIFMVALAKLSTVNNTYSNLAETYFKQLVVLLLLWGLYVYLNLCSENIKKKFVIVYLICIAISAAYTMYVAMVGDDDIIRLTASGVYDESFTFAYGGFDFIYALVLIYTVLLTALRLKWKTTGAFVRVSIILLEALFAFTIIVSGYATAFVLIFVFTLWQLRPRGFFGLVLFGGVMFLIILFPWVITSIIEAIPFIPELTSSRINELILSLYGSGSSEYISAEGQRFSRMFWTLKIFFENPLVGGFVENTELPFGYHTEWLEQLARYGIFTTFLNGSFWFITYKRINQDALENDRSNTTKNCVKNAFIMFLVLGFLDPISMVVTACPLFVLSPFVPIIFLKGVNYETL